MRCSRARHRARTEHHEAGRDASGALAKTLLVQREQRGGFASGSLTYHFERRELRFEWSLRRGALEQYAEGSGTSARLPQARWPTVTAMSVASGNESGNPGQSRGNSSRRLPP